MAVVVVARKATASAKLNCIKEGGLSGRVGQKGVGWASCYLINFASRETEGEERCLVSKVHGPN